MQRILVIDDDPNTAKVVATWFAKDPYEVLSAEDGERGLELARSKRPDLILLDLRMPGIDGMSVLRMIKERWPETEVVIITGYPSLENLKQAVELGACDYLTKPTGPGEVIHAAHGAAARKKWALRRVAAEA